MKSENSLKMCAHSSRKILLVDWEIETRGIIKGSRGEDDIPSGWTEAKDFLIVNKISHFWDCKCKYIEGKFRLLKSLKWIRNQLHFSSHKQVFLAPLRFKNRNLIYYTNPGLEMGRFEDPDSASPKLFRRWTFRR